MAKLLTGTRIYGTATVDTQLFVSGTNVASSTITGALQVAGGVGVGGGVYVGGNVTAPTFIGNLTGVATTATLALNANTATFALNATTATTSTYAFTATNITGGAQGSVHYQSATGTTAMLAIGTNGFVLTSNGTLPSWTAISGLSAGQSTTATNLAGGTLGQVPYQTGAGSTSFFGPGTAGNVLVSNGTGAPTYNNTLTLSGTTAATSTATGALQIAGGVGIGGAGYFGSNVTAPTFIGNLTGIATTATTATWASTASYAISAGTSSYATTATTAANIIGGTTGSLPYQTSTGTTTMLSLGSNGFVLTAGATSPQWTAITGLSAGQSTTSTNLAGGTAGQVPYQSSTGTTSFYGPGTSGQLLVSAGSSAPVYTNTSSIYVGHSVLADYTGNISATTNTNVFEYIIGVSAGGSTTTAATIATTVPIGFNASTGNVGFGINPPTAPLHIVSSANSIVKFRGGTTGTIGILYSDATQVSLVDNGLGNGFIILPGSNAVSLQTNATTALYVDLNQQVGINTNRPNYKLDVRGQTYIGAASTLPQLILGDTTNSTTSTITTNNGDLIFSSTGTTEALRITSAKGIAFGGSTNYGSSGQILQSNGNASPTWVNQNSISSGSAANINATTNTNAFEYIIGVSAGGSTTTAATVSTTNPVGFNASTGVVSIGGTSSYGKLTVIGGTSNASSLATSQSLSTLYVQPKNTSGYGFAFGSGPSDLPYIQQVTTSGNASGNMTLQPYGGYIGIGITNPSYNLVVSSAGAEGIEFGPGYTSGKNLFYSYNRTNSTYVQLDSIASIFTWAIGTSEKLRLTANGGLAFNGSTNYGTSGQILQSNGDAAPTWVNAGSITAGTPSLTSTYIGFGSSSNLLTGSSNLTWSTGTNTLTVTSGTVQTLTFIRTGTYSGSAWTTQSPVFYNNGGLLTDTTSAALSTISARVGASFLSPTFNASNSITVTNAATLYVEAPASSGAVTMSNSWGIWNTGNSLLSGSEKITTSLAVGSYSITANAGDILASGNGMFGYSTAQSGARLSVSGGVYVNGIVTATTFVGAFSGTVTGNASSVTNALTAGTGISYSAGTTYNGSAAITINNSGVTSNVSGTGVSVSGATGAVTISIGQAVSTSSNVQFNSLGVGTAGSATSGEIRATNEITAYYSDRRLKENVKIIDNAVEKVLLLNGIIYTPNDLARSFGYTSNKTIVGLFADEVNAVLPEAVRPAPFDQDENGNSKSGENYKTIQYEKLVPLLVEAIKEQQKQIAQISKMVDNLTNK
jgi:hypothetical protein